MIWAHIGACASSSVVGTGLTGHIRVYPRWRPLNSEEQADPTERVALRGRDYGVYFVEANGEEGAELGVFDGVFDEKSTQEAVFKETKVRPVQPLKVRPTHPHKEGPSCPFPYVCPLHHFVVRPVPRPKVLPLCTKKVLQSMVIQGISRGMFAPYPSLPLTPARPRSLARPLFTARPVSRARPLSPAWPRSAASPLCAARPLSQARPLLAGRPERIFICSFLFGLQDLVQSVVDGTSACVFAYGQSGSGKTFTVFGTEEQPGLLPRAVAELYRQMEKADDKQFTVEVRKDWEERGTRIPFNLGLCIVRTASPWEEPHLESAVMEKSKVHSVASSVSFTALAVTSFSQVQVVELYKDKLRDMLAPQEGTRASGQSRAGTQFPPGGSQSNATPKLKISEDPATVRMLLRHLLNSAW